MHACVCERERDKGERDRREREEGDMRYERVKIRGRGCFLVESKRVFWYFRKFVLGTKSCPVVQRRTRI